MGKPEQLPIILYGRTSKDDKRRLTIENQQETLARWKAADPDSGPIALEQWDVGVSGKIPFPERPGGRAVMDWVEAHPGKKALLVVVYVDRFARDTLSGISTAKELSNAGTLICCINEGLDARRETSQFQFNMRLCFAEEEWHRTHERCEMGKSRAMERDGAPPGGSLQFGFRMGRRGVWEPHPIEAAIVLRVFEMYADGASQNAISAWLRSLRGLTFGSHAQRRDGSAPTYLPTPKGNHAGQSFVQRMLHSRSYIGERMWGGRIFTVPALVPVALFERVQTRLAERRVPFVAKPERENPALLSGILECGICKRPYHSTLKRRRATAASARREVPGGGEGCKSGVLFQGGKRGGVEGEGYRYYRCNSQATIGGRCKGRQFKASLLDEALWPILRSYVENPSELLERLVAGDAEQRAGLDELAATEADLRHQLAACDQEAEQVWEMQRADNLPLSFVQAGLKRILERREGIVRALEAVRMRALEASNKQEDCHAVGAALNSLRAMLPRADKDPAVRAAIAAALVKTGVVHTSGTGRDGEVRITIALRWGEVLYPGMVEKPYEMHLGPSDASDSSGKYQRPETLPLSFTFGTRSA